MNHDHDFPSTLLFLETQLEVLDGKRANMVAAITALRDVFDVEPASAPPRKAPNGSKDRQTDRQSKPRAKVTAVRSLPDRDSIEDRILAALRHAGEPMTPKDLAAAVGTERPRLPPYLEPLEADRLIVVTGTRRGRRIALRAQTVARPTSPSHETGAYETVWAPGRDAPSLTGDASGLGSTLAGKDFKVLR